jgi:23S rRNA pseudouridine1911/1915/1917 synthase
VIGQNETVSLVELQPTTGRTHQLRVHMAKIGHPIVGDPLYSGSKYGERMFLHALKLELNLPITNEPKTFTAPLPDEFAEYMAS